MLVCCLLICLIKVRMFPARERADIELAITSVGSRITTVRCENDRLRCVCQIDHLLLLCLLREDANRAHIELDEQRRQMLGQLHTLFYSNAPLTQHFKERCCCARADRIGGLHLPAIAERFG